jgi:predicted nucleic acid-binding Zn ribbon protein
MTIRLTHCLGCGIRMTWKRRADAKTCSARCRKRITRRSRYQTRAASVTALAKGPQDPKSEQV